MKQDLSSTPSTRPAPASAALSPASFLPLAHWLTAPRPANTVIAWQDQYTWTLAHLRHDVLALIQQLEQQPGTRWALCFDNSYLFIVALLATLHAGKRPVIPGHCRAAQLDEQQTLFDGVISEYPLTCQRPLIQICTPAARISDLSTDTASPMQLPALAADCRVELFTSGSSGQPKRVVKPVSCLDQEARLLARHFAYLLTGCRVIASIVPQHQYGLTFRIMLPMALGLPLHALMLQYAEQLTALPATHRYVFVSSPAFLKRLDNALPAPPVALLLSAGGELPWQAVCHTQHCLGCNVHEIYGSTETGILAWRCREQAACHWQLFDSVYLQQDRDTQAWRACSPMIPDPSGVLLEDKLQFNEQGTFQLGGRCGRVVKIEEKRVSLHDIERRLLTLDGVSEAAALLIDDGKRQSIGVLLVLTESARQRWQANPQPSYPIHWRASLLRWLDPVAVPRYWRVVPAIPVNSMGKRVQAQLLELFYATAHAAS